MTALGLETRNRCHSLLLVGDHPSGTRLFFDRTARAGWRTIACENLRQARAVLDAPPSLEIAAIIVDESAESEDPSEVLADLKCRLPHVPILVIVEGPSPREPLLALRAGATDLVTKPIDPDRLLKVVTAAIHRTSLHRHDVGIPAGYVPPSREFSEIIGADPHFRQALARAAISARGSGHILLEGEPGTGKATFARAIHSASPRAKARLKILEVSSVHEANLEAALFGYLRGAFVGASEARQGLLQECDGATLVIKQVDRLRPPIQERLVEALSQGRVRPIGAEHSFCSDVRVIAMSNGRLSELVASGEFNVELYRMLSSTYIDIPPLRERVGDIPLIARHFLSSFGGSSDLVSQGLSEDALLLLCNLRWPGNIRQLQTALFRAVAFSEGAFLTVEDFVHMAQLASKAEAPSAPGDNDAGIAVYTHDGHLRPMPDIERDVLRLAIGHYHGCISDVARSLRIGRSTIYRKLAELGIET